MKRILLLSLVALSARAEWVFRPAYLASADGQCTTGYILSNTRYPDEEPAVKRYSAEVLLGTGDESWANEMIAKLDAIKHAQELSTRAYKLSTSEKSNKLTHAEFVALCEVMANRKEEEENLARFKFMLAHDTAIQNKMPNFLN